MYIYIYIYVHIYTHTRMRGLFRAWGAKPIQEGLAAMKALKLVSGGSFMWKSRSAVVETVNAPRIDMDWFGNRLEAALQSS